MRSLTVVVMRISLCWLVVILRLSNFDGSCDKSFLCLAQDSTTSNDSGDLNNVDKNLPIDTTIYEKVSPSHMNATTSDDYEVDLDQQQQDQDQEQQQQQQQQQQQSNVNSTIRRLISKEELSSNNGKGPNGTMWLSILSEVYDVTVSPHFYAENHTYNIFVGRDANVPFVTGIFTEEEAAKSILILENRQLYSIEEFLNDTYRSKPEKYPFIGILIGDLYDEKGNPTEILQKVRTIINLEKEIIEEQNRKSEEIRAQWDREAEERRKKELYRKNRGAIQTIKDFFRGEL